MATKKRGRKPADPNQPKKERKKSDVPRGSVTSLLEKSKEKFKEMTVKLNARRDDLNRVISAAQAELKEIENVAASFATLGVTAPHENANAVERED